MSRLARTAVVLLTVTVPFGLTRLALARFSAIEIFVDAAAPAGGDGTTPAAAYRTIREAVNDANASAADVATIRVAAGTYVEAPNITITRDHVRLLGATQHTLDARGLPTGEVATPAVLNPDAATAPAGTALLRIHGSHVEIAGLVFDGGFPRPPAGPTGQGVPLLRADGAVAQRPLEGLHIRGNSFQNSTQGLFFRLSKATISGNFIARNTNGVSYYAGFADPAGSEGPGPHVVFEGNRVVDHVNSGSIFLGFVGSLLPPSFASLGLAAAPGVNHVVIANNDYARNADARTPVNGVFYPQPLQYSALLFNTAGSDNSDQLQPGRINVTIAANTFAENGYGIGVNQRVALVLPQASHLFEAQLAGNKYCGNAFNRMMVDFGLITQSHGTTGAGAAFRYAQGTTYAIDGSQDQLVEDDLDWDHPATDPRLPAAGVLGNTLLFNGLPIPNGVKLTRPPLVSPGPPPVYGQPVTVPDTTPPDITSAGATPSVLWPPDERMVPVAVQASAQDRCDPAPVCKVVSVTSDEAPVPGPDWIFTSPLALQLRAKRTGVAGTDRMYTVTVACSDAAGNVSTANIAVRVPHDQRR